MKALSIRQPWASLIACGLKDVENRKWALKTLPVRVLLHAGARRLCNEDDLGYIEFIPVDNYKIMGILPHLDTVPVSAIIGVATIDRCVEHSDSIWAQEGPGAEYKWVMKDPVMFKQPITGVKGALGLFDVTDIDESNLPEAAEIPQPKRDGTTLTMPVCDKIFEDYSVSVDGKEFYFNLLDSNLSLFCNEELNPLPTDTIVFSNKGRSIIAKVVSVEVADVCCEDGPISFEDCHGRIYDWVRIFYTLANS